jgi:hypothetical protein
LFKRKKLFHKFTDGDFWIFNHIVSEKKSITLIGQRRHHGLTFNDFKKWFRSHVRGKGGSHQIRTFRKSWSSIRLSYWIVSCHMSILLRMLDISIYSKIKFPLYRIMKQRNFRSQIYELKHFSLDKNLFFSGKVLISSRQMKSKALNQSC